MKYFSNMQKPTIVSLLCLAVVGMTTTTVGAQTLAQCDTQAEQEGDTCQRWCRCECDEYWNDDDFCANVCDIIDYGSPIESLDWCADYSLADDCDQYGSNWKESTITSELEITYMQAYGKDFKLNFFTDTSRGPDELLPLAVIIHGGGFNSGSKNNCKQFEAARVFAARGYRAIAINYPMCGAYWKGVDVGEDVPDFGTSDQGWHAWDADTPLYPNQIGQQHEQCFFGAAHSNTHPEQYAQAAEVANRAARYAILYAHDNAAEWGIDVDQTVCYGGSAGAISCTETFLFDTNVRYRPEISGLPIDPNLDQVKINVATGRAGGLLRIRNVTQEIVDAMPPNAAAWDLHGDEDETVDIAVAEFLVEEMERFNIPAELVVAPGQNHSIFNYQFVEDNSSLDDMFCFIERYLLGTDECQSGDQEDEDDDQEAGGGGGLISGGSPFRVGGNRLRRLFD